MANDSVHDRTASKAIIGANDHSIIVRSWSGIRGQILHNDLFIAKIVQSYWKFGVGENLSEFSGLLFNTVIVLLALGKHKVLFW